MAVQTTTLFGPEKVISQMPHAIWRGNQMAFYPIATLTSGFPRLDAELPHAGWPYSALTELLILQAGIGEIQLLKPALISQASLTPGRRIAFIQPPHFLQIAAFQSWGLPTGQLIWVNAKCAADALWAAEQILRNGSCGAVVLWQTQVHVNALRRLHLAAQETSTVCWMIRSLANAQDASPAPLRVVLRPASGGIEIDLIKRRGPPSCGPFYLPLPDMPAAPMWSNHATVDRRPSAIAGSRNIPAILV